jgi:hypothetical protein
MIAWRVKRLAPLPCRTWLAAHVACTLLVLSAAGTVRAEERLDFNRDIRPILSNNCFHCHGPDASHREADLRLDVREEALTAKAIVPGKPEASGLVERVFSESEYEVMPPPEANKKLTSAEKELLRRWIAEGAEYQTHWAFIAPVRPAVPEVDAPGIVNPIDNFIRARLKRENLSPSPEADRTTLIRRVSLDLTGIPPTHEEIDAFLADESPDAYERLVDRLLASPRYGERMAIHWLDYARYADSNGFQTDSSRQMWRWRDWAIDAFNRNQPFDEFTIDQLAGDMRSAPTQDQIIATGFHRNARLNGEGGRIVEEWFAETVIDRVDTTGQTWLALTIGCARCHDHKYDPISQREFYQLFAFFNSIDESGVLDGGGGNRGGGNSKPILAAPTEDQLAQKSKLQSELTAIQTRLKAVEAGLPEMQATWEKDFAAKLTDQATVWSPLEVTKVESRGGATMTRQDDGTWLASGKTPNHDVYTIVAKLPQGEFSGLRLEVLPDPSLPNQSLGRASNGNFVLTSVEMEWMSPQEEKPQPILIARADADFSQKGYEASSLISGSNGKGWAIEGNNPANRLTRRAMFLAKAATPIPSDTQLIIRLKHESQFAGHNIGRFRLAYTSLPPGTVKLTGSEVPELVRAALEIDPPQRSAEQRKALSSFHRENINQPYAQVKSELAAKQKSIADLEASFPTTMVMKELPKPREAHILVRGEYHNQGDRVERGLPAFLPGLPEGAPVDRLGLAQWIVSRENPLTARVWVNRQWARLFGTGLVKTIDNFGVQSDAPSHPELLDWLATEFMRRDWDMKAMQKLFVMSATYRQSARVTPELLERDPENRLLARGPRFRLPAEIIRDQALAISGLLVEQVGGPSVRPYMPEGVWDETSKYGDLRGYKHGQGADLYRRSLYTIWKRTAAPPTMLMFDSPSRELCTVSRSRTNTPLQALALLNEVTFVEAARALAQRMMTEGGSHVDDRLIWGFRLATSRSPDDAELAILRAGFERYLAKFQADPKAAQTLIATGESSLPEGVNPVELAAWTLTANVLLNLDEVVTRE